VPPTGGEGGNTAIRDAGALVKRLTKIASAKDREATLSVEIEEYEKEMLKFSRGSVNRSYRNSTTITVEGYIFPYLLRGFLRIINFFFGAKAAA
jgi:2-polyprenyl-6-methoxyphenol hydroxylase-like FAD-dependent oxidoreductase